jgi:hypothetical protein
MSTLVAIDGVIYDLEAPASVPDGVTALVGEPSRDDAGDDAAEIEPVANERAPGS